MSDLTNLMMDPDLGSVGFTIVRRRYTRNKASVDETRTLIPANGCVFPGTPEMSQLLPAEEQGKDFIKVHTPQQLLLGDNSTTGVHYRGADLILFRGKTWKVVRVKDWTTFSFYVGYAVLEPEGDASLDPVPPDPDVTNPASPDPDLPDPDLPDPASPDPAP